jgi:preprotein translocase subunit SecY
MSEAYVLGSDGIPLKLPSEGGDIPNHSTLALVSVAIILVAVVILALLLYLYHVEREIREVREQREQESKPMVSYGTRQFRTPEFY